MKPLLKKLIGEATRLTRAGDLANATAAIQRALDGSTPITGSRAQRTAAPPGGVAVLDGLVREVRPPARAPRPFVFGVEPRPGGSFEESSYTGRTGTRAYKLFVPSGFEGRELPLIVMLHGCTQDPDDFAAGTRMNEVAQERGLLVLYPAQAPRSNHSKCWNWFVPADQRRGAGEPELIASMTRHIVATHPVDPLRVYVAGLSAGGAMADILGREYPDLYAAVGIHSGLAQGAARDVASAFAAMQHGPGARTSAFRPESPFENAAPDRNRASGAAPAIVFHGDRDSTVHPSNGEQVVGAALGSLPDESGQQIHSTSARSSTAGREVTHTVHRMRNAAPDEPSLAEHWLVHGTGHAWSGGSAAGSYTDVRGPDASREMVRFFLEHPLRRS